jgi:hypothetical protein
LTLKDGTTVRWGDMTAREATFSPDGRWVAYGTRGPSGNQVFVEPFPRTGAKYLLPIIGGHPFWSPRGDELITNSSPVENHVTAVLASRGFAFGQPAPFARRGRQEPNPLTGRRNVDIMPDGQQVVGVMSQAGLSQGPDAPAFTQIIVVLNWFDELRQRVPLP